MYTIKDVLKYISTIDRRQIDKNFKLTKSNKDLYNEIDNVIYRLKNDSLLKYLSAFGAFPKSFKIAYDHYRNLEREAEMQIRGDVTTNVHDPIFRSHRDAVRGNLKKLYPTTAELNDEILKLLDTCTGGAKDESKNLKAFIKFIKDGLAKGSSIGSITRDSMLLVLSYFSDKTSKWAQDDKQRALNKVLIESMSGGYMGEGGRDGSNPSHYSCWPGIEERLLDEIHSNTDLGIESNERDILKIYAEKILTSYASGDESRLLTTALWYALEMQQYSWEDAHDRKKALKYEGEVLSASNHILKNAVAAWQKHNYDDSYINSCREAIDLLVQESDSQHMLSDQFGKHKSSVQMKSLKKERILTEFIRSFLGRDVHLKDKALYIDQERKPSILGQLASMMPTIYKPQYTAPTNELVKLKDDDINKRLNAYFEKESSREIARIGLIDAKDDTDIKLPQGFSYSEPQSVPFKRAYQDGKTVDTDSVLEALDNSFHSKYGHGIDNGESLLEEIAKLTKLTADQIRCAMFKTTQAVNPIKGIYNMLSTSIMYDDRAAPYDLASFKNKCDEDYAIRSRAVNAVLHEWHNGMYDRTEIIFSLWEMPQDNMQVHIDEIDKLIKDLKRKFGIITTDDIMQSIISYMPQCSCEMLDHLLVNVDIGIDSKTTLFDYICSKLDDFWKPIPYIEGEKFDMHSFVFSKTPSEQAEIAEKYQKLVSPDANGRYSFPKWVWMRYAISYGLTNTINHIFQIKGNEFYNDDKSFAYDKAFMPWVFQVINVSFTSTNRTQSRSGDTQKQIMDIFSKNGCDFGHESKIVKFNLATSIFNGFENDICYNTEFLRERGYLRPDDDISGNLFKAYYTTENLLSQIRHYIDSGYVNPSTIPTNHERYNYTVTTAKDVVMYYLSIGAKCVGNELILHGSNPDYSRQNRGYHSYLSLWLLPGLYPIEQVRDMFGKLVAGMPESFFKTDKCLTLLLKLLRLRDFELLNIIFKKMPEDKSELMSVFKNIAMKMLLLPIKNVSVRYISPGDEYDLMKNILQLPGDLVDNLTIDQYEEYGMGIAQEFGPLFESSFDRALLIDQYKQNDLVSKSSFMAEIDGRKSLMGLIAFAIISKDAMRNINLLIEHGLSVNNVGVNGQSQIHMFIEFWLNVENEKAFWDFVNVHKPNLNYISCRNSQLVSLETDYRNYQMRQLKRQSDFRILIPNFLKYKDYGQPMSFCANIIVFCVCMFKIAICRLNLKISPKIKLMNIKTDSSEIMRMPKSLNKKYLEDLDKCSITQPALMNMWFFYDGLSQTDTEILFGKLKEKGLDTCLINKPNTDGIDFVKNMEFLDSVIVNFSLQQSRKLRYEMFFDLYVDSKLDVSVSSSESKQDSQVSVIQLILNKAIYMIHARDCKMKNDRGNIMLDHNDHININIFSFCSFILERYSHCIDPTIFYMPDFKALSSEAYSPYGSRKGLGRDYFSEVQSFEVHFGNFHKLALISLIDDPQRLITLDTPMYFNLMTGLLDIIPRNNDNEYRLNGGCDKYFVGDAEYRPTMGLDYMSTVKLKTPSRIVLFLDRPMPVLMLVLLNKVDKVLAKCAPDDRCLILATGLLDRGVNPFKENDKDVQYQCSGPLINSRLGAPKVLPHQYNFTSPITLACGLDHRIVQRMLDVLLVDKHDSNIALIRGSLYNDQSDAEQFKLFIKSLHDAVGGEEAHKALTHEVIDAFDLLYKLTILPEPDVDALLSQLRDYRACLSSTQENWLKAFEQKIISSSLDQMPGALLSEPKLESGAGVPESQTTDSDKSESEDTQQDQEGVRRRGRP